MKLSARAIEMPASPIRKLVPLSDAAKARGVHVHHLNIGQPDIETPRAMLEAYRGFDAKVLAYGPSLGLPELREGIARSYAGLGYPVAPEQVYVTTGGSEALAFAFAAVGDPGDELLVFEPFYANYLGVAVMLGLKLVPVRADAASGFHLPPDERIEAKIGPRTKAIVFGSPGNPTGAVYSKAEMERLGRLASKHGLTLISDEVYREFVYGETVATSALALPCADERVVVVDSISKRFSACGGRIGCVITRNPDLGGAFTRMAFARLCPPTVDQIAAIAGYALPQDYFDPVIVEYRRRRDVLVAGLNAIPGVHTYLPEGAFYTVVTLPVKDADDFCAWLLTGFAHRGETVMMAPASGFYATPGLGTGEARIAYVLNVESLARSCEILREALAVYPGRTTK